MDFKQIFFGWSETDRIESATPMPNEAAKAFCLYLNGLQDPPPFTVERLDGRLDAWVIAKHDGNDNRYLIAVEGLRATV